MHVLNYQIIMEVLGLILPQQAAAPQRNVVHDLVHSLDTGILTWMALHTMTIVEEWLQYFQMYQLHIRFPM